LGLDKDCQGFGLDERIAMAARKQVELFSFLLLLLEQSNDTQRQIRRKSFLKWTVRDYKTSVKGNLRLLTLI
jgi:hypothetical protein